MDESQEEGRATLSVMLRLRPALARRLEAEAKRWQLPVATTARLLMAQRLRQLDDDPGGLMGQVAPWYDVDE